MRPKNRRVSEPISDEASTQPQNVAPRRRGHGRDRGRGRLGRGGGMPEVDVPRATHGNPTLA